MTLFGDFLNTTPKSTFKWLHYFSIYEKRFSHLINQSCSILEIGVRGGGSLTLWRNYFGPRARILGIDIDPSTKLHEDFNITVEIGDQADHDFLDSIYRKYGPFDLVIDDGSHKSTDVKSTLEFFLDKMPKNAIYLIEDTHMSLSKRFNGSETDIFDYIQPLVKYQSSGYVDSDTKPVEDVSTNIYAVSFYDSIIALEFQEPHLRLAKDLSTNLNQSIRETLRPGFL